MLANQHRWHVSPTPTVWDRLVQRIQTCRTASAERTNQEASTANKDGIATVSLGKGCAGA